MLNPDNYSVETKILVPFHDADPAGVVWHGRYVKYFELARCELLDKFNYSYRVMEQSGYLWPIVDMRVKYVKPLVFDQNILVCASIKEWRYRLKIEYLIRDAKTLEKTTKGYTVQVAYDIKNKLVQYESPIALKQALGINSDD